MGSKRLKVGDLVEVYLRRGVFRWAPAIVRAVGDVSAVVVIPSFTKRNVKTVLLGQEGKAWRRMRCEFGSPHEQLGPPQPFCCEDRKRQVLKLEAGEHPVVPRKPRSKR